ncbi:MAG: aldehyde ferredoxin oxidoreductase, partial [Candidatus Methanofastidiosa archaeon]|nr:aldehyde ferredoxin oxidoreductase [Candidatus Methanofastidiosa archaeon]
MFGWSGRMLDVFLSDFTSSFFDSPYLNEFIGGRGLGVRLFIERTSPKVDPLSPECPIIFTFGPLTGTMAPTSGRFSAVSKSPLTNTIFDSNCGGFFAGKGRACGIDGFILNGRCDRPSIIYIDEGGARMDDASSVWGSGIEESSIYLQERYGSGAGILTIGPAGENLVLFSTISTDDMRMLGRGGLGAVMGSKNVKAIVVRGSQRTEVHDSEQLKFVCKQARKLIEANPITSKGLKAFGTPILVNIINGMGIFPNYNYRYSQTDKAGMVSGETINSTMFERRKACQSCYIACDRITNMNGVRSRGPEYESVWALGPNCGIFDLDSIAMSNHLCNNLGLDTISCGSTIACAMELFENGMLKGGVGFGHSDLSSIIISIAHREGLGNELALGSRR